jgi:hypothetical protein
MAQPQSCAIFLCLSFIISKIKKVQRQNRCTFFILYVKQLLLAEVLEG